MNQPLKTRQLGYYPVTLTSGGEPVQRTLYYSFYSLMRFEEETGHDLSSLGEGNLSFKMIAGLIWAGLLWENDSLTLKEVAEQVPFHHLEAVTSTVMEALGMGAGESEKKTPVPGLVTNGTGPPSFVSDLDTSDISRTN